MNAGEKNEFLLKIYLTYLRDNNPELDTPFGKINKVGFEKNYKRVPKDLDFDLLEKNEEKSDREIKKIMKELSIEKAPPLSKADIYINNVSYSLKFLNAAPPSIVNHTNRKGFINIANKLKLNIGSLDKLIDKYWDLRIKGKIGEDVKNSEENSPFKNHKDVIKPYLEYFCFTGTGSKDSKHPADKIFKFFHYKDQKTWSILEKFEAIDEIWDGLKFCMRGGRGMPIKNKKCGYKMSKDKKIIAPWTRFSSKKYRGALSIRYKSPG